MQTAKCNIGQIICEHLKKEGRTKTWLAEQVNYTPSALGKMLKRNGIYPDIISKISSALDHDFAQYLSDHFHKSKRNNNFAE